MLEEDVEVTCPYCWQNITLELDLTVEGQSCVEDCPVCCQPILVSYAADGGTLTSVRVERER